jgi:hypothetical protein
MRLSDWLKPKPGLDAGLRAKIDQAVSAVDPLIKQIAGYQRRLAPAVQCALAHCSEIAARIPGPVMIIRAAFASDPLVHALFSSADTIDQMFATSQCVRENFACLTLQTGQCCALLGMRRNEKSGFGAELAGEIVRADVPQRTLYFTDHTLAEPAPDEASLRKRLVEVFFDGLVRAIAEHVEAVRCEQAALDKEKAIASAQLRAGESNAVQTRRLESLRARLAATRDALQPEHLLETLASKLEAPENLLNLMPIELRVDRNGVIRDGAGKGDLLHFAELSTRDRRRRVALLALLDHVEVRRAHERYETARHYLLV